jgi:hypothetical protein
MKRILHGKSEKKKTKGLHRKNDNQECSGH